MCLECWGISFKSESIYKVIFKGKSHILTHEHHHLLVDEANGCEFLIDVGLLRITGKSRNYECEMKNEFSHNDSA